MSTGENINANQSVLTADLVRWGFHRFPQTTHVEINPSYFSEIAPIQIATGYPFTCFSNPAVTPGELWYIEGNTNNLLGRIINIGLPSQQTTK